MSKQNADDRYADALELVQFGQYQQADRLLLETLEGSPKAAQSVYLLGITRLMLGQPLVADHLIASAYRRKAWIREDALEFDNVAAVLRQQVEERPDWDWARYATEHQRFFSYGLSLDNLVMLGHLGADTTFVQVGANDGISGDPIHRHIVENGWRGVVIEPQPVPFAALKNTYGNCEGVTFENSAVADVEEGFVDLYVGEKSTLATTVRGRNSLDRTETAVRTLRVRARRIEDILVEHGVADFDLYQIDTEGADYQILAGTDFNLFTPSVVQFEFYCLPIAERRASFELLAAHGYAYRVLGRDLIAVRLDAATSYDFGIIDTWS